MEIPFALSLRSKYAAETLVRAQKIYSMETCVEIKISLLVLTFDSTGNV